MSFLRDAQRFCVDLECDYSYNKKKVNRCKIFDISEKGMLLKLDIPIEIQDNLTLFLQNYDNNISVIKVKAVHKKNNFIGVKFLDYTTNFKESIKQLIKQYAIA